MSRPALSEKFRAVTAERLGRLRGALPALSTEPDQLTVVARELHTIKGEAQLVGFVHVARVARRLEELLGDGASVTPLAQARMLEGLDAIEALRAMAMDDDESAAAADAFCGASDP